MTAAQETHEGAAEAASGGRQVSRHRAASYSSSSAPARAAWGGQLTALAVVPCAVASLLGVSAVIALVRASHSPLRGNTIAALGVLGIMLLAVIMAGFVWAGHVAETAKSEGGDADGAAYQHESAPVSEVPAAASEIAETQVFVQLSRRLQSLVARQIDVLDDLENRVEDPGLLKGLFAVDHLSTRMRRHAESLGVLGGALPRRQWTKPVSVTEVLRSAVSETIDYPRVQVIADATGLLQGYAVADVVHLLAELVENATSFSPEDAKVVLHTEYVPAGLAIEIDDRGLALAPEAYRSLNALLRESAPFGVQQLLKDARIGLYVVARLARGHHIPVELERNIFGGTKAVVVLPNELLANGPEAGSAAPSAADSEATVWRPGGVADAPVPGVALPAPRRSADAQAAAPTGSRGSAPAVQSPHVYAPGTRQQAAAMPLSGPEAQTGPSDQTAAERPALPRRQPQQHLSPLLAGTADSGASEPDRGGELNPGLMAGYKQGLARGYAQPTPEGPTDEHAPTQEGRS